MSELWRLLEGVPAYRVTEIPQRAAATDDSRESSTGTDPNRGQRVAALAAAYHAGVVPRGAGRGAAGAAPGAGVVGFGWVRLGSDGPVHVVAVGDALAGSMVDAGQVLLALPGGARADRMVGLVELLDKLPVWREIAVVSDGSLAEERRGRDPGTSLEDVLLGSWVASFGWMLIAEPVRAGQLRELADNTASRLRLVESTADRFPARALDAERLKYRLAELRRGFSQACGECGCSPGRGMRSRPRG